MPVAPELLRALAFANTENSRTGAGTDVGEAWGKETYLDRALQEIINGWAGHSSALDFIMEIIARDVIYLIGPLAVLLWLWRGTPTSRAAKQHLVLSLFVAIALALAFTALLGEIRSSERPFVVLPSTHLLIKHAADNSFPSSHTAVAFAVACGLLLWNRRLGLAALVLAALIGFSRVYVGVHWPIDVALGAGVGVVAATFARLPKSALEAIHRGAGRVLPDVLLVARQENRRNDC